MTIDQQGIACISGLPVTVIAKQEAGFLYRGGVHETLRRFNQLQIGTCVRLEAAPPT